MLSAPPSLSGEQARCSVAPRWAPASIFNEPACENSCDAACAPAAAASMKAPRTTSWRAQQLLMAMNLLQIAVRCTEEREGEGRANITTLGGLRGGAPELGDRLGHASGGERLLARCVA